MLEDVSEPLDLLRRATLRRHCPQRVVFLLLLSSSSLLASNAGAVRKRREEESTTSAALPDKTGKDRSGAPMEHGQAACSDTSCGTGSLRAAGRVPSGGGICARRPTFVSCFSTSPALAVLSPREEWCLYTARAISTDSFSWRAHWPRPHRQVRDRSWQPLETQTKKRLVLWLALCCVALWWLWWLWCGRVANARVCPYARKMQLVGHGPVPVR